MESVRPPPPTRADPASPTRSTVQWCFGGSRGGGSRRPLTTAWLGQPARRPLATAWPGPRARRSLAAARPPPIDVSGDFDLPLSIGVTGAAAFPSHRDGAGSRSLGLDYTRDEYGTVK